MKQSYRTSSARHYVPRETTEETQLIKRRTPPKRRGSFQTNHLIERTAEGITAPAGKSSEAAFTAGRIR